MPSKWQTRLVVFEGLHHKIQVRRMSQSLGVHPNQVVGALLQVWFKAQATATEAGLLEGKSAGWLDLIAEQPGLAAAMIGVGWLLETPDGVTVGNFTEYIAKTAVKKLEHTIRVARVRAGSAEGGELIVSHAAHNCAHAAQKVADVSTTPIVPAPAKKKAKGGTALGSPLFDRFWAAYPKKSAKSDAARAFHKLEVTEELLVRILAAIEKQAKGESWRKDGGQFIPYPATWLNGRRWEDEVTAGGNAGGVRASGRVFAEPGKYDRPKRLIIADAGAEVLPRPATEGGQPSLFTTDPP